jgi:hypothetical protein
MISLTESKKDTMNLIIHWLIIGALVLVAIAVGVRVWHKAKLKFGGGEQ